MRNCEYIGNPAMFRSRVMGVGSQRAWTKEELVGICERFPNEPSCNDTSRLAACHPDSPPGTCKPWDWNPDAGPDWVSRGREIALESERMLKDAEKWRSNTPIVSFTSPNASGVARTINVYGYNKETGYVWVAEGPNSSAANSQLLPELVLGSKFPEWVAWKSGSTSALPLPLLLGAAYLLLA